MTDQVCINTIRITAAEMVQKANSGHPGAPMGLAPVAHTLFHKIMKFNPKNPKFWNRDRFVLSNGHACALLYTMLHLSGYDLSIDDLKAFRSLDSKTPGHPESHITPGIEVTTGPLGQGVANAVGLAMAQKHMAAIYNKPGFDLFNNMVYAICGDGCLQEGVASEAISLAGTLQLGNLVLLYDDNKIQIDGSTDLAFSEDIPKRFESMGWNHLVVEKGDSDFEQIFETIKQAKVLAGETNKPTVVSVKTTIGFGAKKQGTADVHGSPLGKDDLARVKAEFGVTGEAFEISKDVHDVYASCVTKGAQYQAEYDALLAQYTEKYPTEAKELNDRMNNGGLPVDWMDSIPKYNNTVITDGIATKNADATRNTSGIVLNAFADKITSLVGGSADLTGSNKTWINSSSSYCPKNPQNRYIHFGVREHAMVAIGNGMEAYGGIIPFTATFFNFIEYAYGAVRLAALSQHKHLLIMTHDSIGLGEDGPTHQPIEAFALTRATPNTLTFRPADINEVSGAYAIALQHNGPSVFCLSRQNVNLLPTSTPSKVLKGGYIVEEYVNTTSTKATEKLVLISTGTELDVATATAKVIQACQETVYKYINVVSMPSLELFDEQSVEYRQSILPLDAFVVSIEPSSQNGWEKYAHRHISMTTFGASAPIPALYKNFGFEPTGIIASLKQFDDEYQTVGYGNGKYPLLQAQFVQPKNKYSHIKPF
jgi:transketolase